MGWMGQAEDAEAAVLAREKGMCSFAFFASKLRKGLKKASAGGIESDRTGCFEASSSVRWVEASSGVRWVGQCRAGVQIQDSCD